MKPLISMCAALPLPEPDQAGSAAAWIHLLPAGEIIRTADGRGPYRVTDPNDLIRVSMLSDARLPLDENHATDLAAPKGAPAPARGWIVDMQSRADGIWGRVEWTEAGRQLVQDRAYRHISPVISHLTNGEVTGILRASLVNRPNLRGLAALHAETGSDEFLSKLRSALGLEDDADEAAILGKVADLTGEASPQAMTMAPLATILGLSTQASSDAVLQAVRRLADPARMVPIETVVSLQTEISDLKTSRARERAEAFVDAAIKAGKIAAPAKMRPHYVARHIADPESVETELGAMASLHARGPSSAVPPAGQASGTALDGDEARVASLIGIDAKTFEASKADIAAREERGPFPKKQST